MSVKKINLHIYPSPITNESRILKITQSLASNGVFNSIYIIGVHENGLKERESLDPLRHIVRIKRKLFRNNHGFAGKVIKTVEWSVRLLGFARGKKIACINCHSLPVLPICVILKYWTGARLIYDTHELETETVTMNGIKKSLFRTMEKMLIPHVDATVVVGAEISKWYAAEYKMHPPHIVRNVPYRKKGKAEKSPLLRQKLQINNDELVFLTSGVLDIGRGIERLLQVFSQCNISSHMVFMGYGPYEQMIREFSAQFKNIHLLPAVEPEEVQEFVSGADVGVCQIEPLCLSYKYSLPNKLFEYLMAGLPVWINDLPEQRRILDSYSCGWLASGDSAQMVEFVRNLSKEEIDLKGKNCDILHREMGWQNEEQVLLDLYRKFFRWEESVSDPSF